GDANYTSASSAAISETVLLTASKTPLLVPSLGATTLPALFLPGDKGTVPVTLTNAGGGRARGAVGVNLYLSRSGVIDTSSILLTSRAFRRSVNIGIGQTFSFSVPFAVGSVMAGPYKLVAQVVPLSRFTADEVSSAAV